MRRSNKGFTLVELIIVIAILAIIMLIAIPNFSGIQQRMQVRADKATAAQIGKAVRTWYTDTTSDKALKTARGTSLTAVIATSKTQSPVIYSELADFSGYMASGSYPKSLRGDKTGHVGEAIPNQGFGVLISGSSTGSKVIVAIGETNAAKTGWATTSDYLISNTITGDDVSGEDTFTYAETYNGSETAVAYIEP